MCVGYHLLLILPMPRRELSEFFLLAAKVKDSTRQRYREAIQQFFNYCDDNNIDADTTSELDWALAEYMHDEYERRCGAGRTKMAHTVAGLQLFVPQLRGKLRVSAQCLLAWKKQHPGARHPPLTWHLAVAIATQLAAWGRFSMAVGTLLAFASLLRIGELCALLVEDVLDGGADDPRVDIRARSGLRLRKTKTADNLFAELHNGDVLRLLRVLMQHKRPSDRLFDFTAGNFRVWFKKAVVALRLDTRYVPHSLRHGGATALYMAGESVETILHRGRWATTKSARYYVQSGEALLLAQQPNLAARDVGRAAAANLFAILCEMRRQCPGSVRASSSRRHTVRQRQQQQLPVGPARHSSRQDWHVRVDYAALDDWTLKRAPR